MTAINMERRRSVMSRSVRLGHCVCDPTQGCPCDTFRLHNRCPCAGEKPPLPTGAVALTKLVRKAGCASKIPQADLLRLLAELPPVADPQVLVGAAAGDDAGVYRLSDDLALVQTIDVFTPCVDDPRMFGRIAAANSVSDVYAMGGRPISALSAVGFPLDDVDGAVLTEMMQGGMEKLAEAGCALIGGHSWQDAEIKLGFAVTGLIHPDRAVRRGAARAGDALVLTKALGTGMVAFGAQIGRITPEALADASRSMATLNRDAAEAMVRHEAHAATDVTGFGLAGHLIEMMRASRCSCRIDANALPVFRAVPQCLAGGVLSGAVERNQEYAMGWVRADEPSAEPLLPIFYDPQTSGGMLISLPPDRARRLRDELQAKGHAETRLIGQVYANEPGAESRMVVVGSALDACRGPEHSMRESAAP
ncbi:MAG: selenide, water dikinase SelD [Kiritimatiellae bacterium]|nr:selenide, water dikinase SelD [Kiritimatiellia bacterium]